ncbi:MAG: hypothetical protein GY944_25960 [bacterium]|nr:hypothetical protein [bacterium]
MSPPMPWIGGTGREFRELLASNPPSPLREVLVGMQKAAQEYDAVLMALKTHQAVKGIGVVYVSFSRTPNVRSEHVPGLLSTTGAGMISMLYLGAGAKCAYRSTSKASLGGQGSVRGHYDCTLGNGDPVGAIFEICSSGKGEAMLVFYGDQRTWSHRLAEYEALARSFRFAN